MRERKMTILSGPSREQLIDAFRYENLVQLRVRDRGTLAKFSLFAGIEDLIDKGEDDFMMSLKILATEDASGEIRSLFDFRRMIKDVRYFTDSSTGIFFV